MDTVVKNIQGRNIEVKNGHGGEVSVEVGAGYSSTRDRRQSKKKIIIMFQAIRASLDNKGHTFLKFSIGVIT
jgi:hypothetical protein